jgi:hypothetical protein
MTRAMSRVSQLQHIPDHTGSRVSFQELASRQDSMEHQAEGFASTYFQEA